MALNKNSIITLSVILIIILLVIVGFVVYLLNMYNPALVNGVVDAKYPLDIVSNNLAATLNEFTLSFWYYVDGWNYKYNEEKTLLDWDNGTLHIAFKPKDNSMVITMKDRDGNSRSCVVEDVKLQKWNFVSLTLWNRSLDVIIDTKYSHSCAQDTSPDYTKSTDMNLFGNDGFNGKLANLYFYNYARKVSDTLKLYNNGPFETDWILALASKLQGSIKVSINVDVDMNVGWN